MLATFADESWQSNFWAEHIVLAHINLKQNLDWFYELLSKLRRENPELEEFKSHMVINLMNKLDADTRKRIWQKIQDTIIIVQDPKEYIRESGLSILPDGSFKFRYEGKELLVERHDKHFKHLNEMLQKELSRLILIESPITKIGFSLSEIPLLHPRGNFFSPEQILSLIGKKDSKKEVMGVIKLAARLCSAFIEVIDPRTRKRILEQFYSYESHFLFLLPHYHKEMLKQAVSSDRFFDKGHQQSTDIIKQCFDAIEESLTYGEDGIETFRYGRVSELDSKESIQIQACDWASGIARNIYEREGLKGLKERFNCVIFNGKII
jgi:hypothetical protein